MISSPADPALLMFKLDKLHQSQNPSATNSVATSPRPAVDYTPSPSQVQVVIHPGTVTASPNHAIAFSPFGPQANLGSDQIFPHNLNMNHPTPKSPNSVGSPSPRPLSWPNFIRGFGPDIPEEEEPPEETDANNEEDAAMPNRIHSRHVSRLSATLSLRSVGRQQDSLLDARSPIVDSTVER